ncbi:uncharacterized protein LOC131036499 isoform X1 [Cryptomeria japonica]|uniref:uncharacterized protein LOC131036499 isoform X1 n=1 Tax=Cryptomeria japonica TaxID=3369 RepID=UPI0027DA6D38|nr:uncharacterized protein LOC131036499 isoform X1 [Cryptomeria japonica]
MSGIILFKSQLQEYTQKASLPLPVYETAKEGPPHDPKFKATVIVNGARYDSTSNFSSIKAAEQSAAQVALEDLLKKPDQEKGVSSQVHKTGLCKSVLQAYAQKMSLPVPIYKTTRSGESHPPIFISTVQVADVFYTGCVASSRKEAEIKAAQKALMAIEPQACDSISQAGTQNLSGLQAANPNMSGSQDPVSNICDSISQAGTQTLSGLQAANPNMSGYQDPVSNICDSISQAGTQNLSGLQAANPNMSGSQDPVSNICSQAGEDSQIKRDTDKEVSCEECKPVKPKQSPSIGSFTPEDKKLINEMGLCKNLLQVYAQRISLPVPVYRSTRSGEIHLPVFISTVEFAGVSYTGGAASTKKEAEIKAAQQALMALQPQDCDFISQAAVQNLSHVQATDSNMSSCQVPIPSICSQSGEDSQRKRSRDMEVTSEECKAIKLDQGTNISHSTSKDEALKHVRGLYKNLLQEYTQKVNLALPIYTFSKSGEVHSPIFISTVQVCGVSYTGGIANSKKEAASKAARKALVALKSQACDSASQVPTQNILGCQAPNQDVSASPVSISEFSERKRDGDVDIAIEDINAIKSKQSTSDAGA